MKLSFALAVLLYGASAIKLSIKSRHRDGGEAPPPLIPDEAADCIIALAEAEGYEDVDRRDAVHFTAYCYCE